MFLDAIAKSGGGGGGTGGGGVTPTFSIGKVETLDPGSDATASISGTAANPVLNLGIPKGMPGEVGEGGSGDLKWKLISVVDITEGATEFTITKDDSGNAFSYQEILIKSSSYPPYSGYLYVRADASAALSNNVQVWPTAGKSLSMTLGLLNGKLGMTSVYRADGPVGTLFENGGGAIDLTEISYLAFGSSAGFTGNGTIYIYGR
jgi:hypothetical protein